MKKTIRIFEDVGGYYVCDNDLDYLDTRGACFPTVRAALNYCRDVLTMDGYTHYARGHRVRKLA